MAVALAAGAQDAAPPAPAPVPDPALLEFLAEFGDAEGDFADPTEVAGALERGDDPAADDTNEADDDDDAQPPPDR